MGLVVGKRRSTPNRYVGPHKYFDEVRTNSLTASGKTISIITALIASKTRTIRTISSFSVERLRLGAIS